jgi:hypothetical protein
MTTFVPLPWSTSRQNLPVASDLTNICSPGCTSVPPSRLNSWNCVLAAQPLLLLMYAGDVALSTVTKLPLPLPMVTAAPAVAALPATWNVRLNVAAGLLPAAGTLNVGCALPAGLCTKGRPSNSKDSPV